MGKAPRGKEDRREGLDKSSTCEMGMQVPCGDPAEVSEESVLREGSAENRGDTSRSVPPERCGLGRRQGDAGSHSHVGECAAEVQHSHDNWIFEGKECGSHPSAGIGNERDPVWPELLGTRVLRKHSWS